jgi:hypothetical protein
MLSLGSLAVAPLNPVAVGEGWTLWEDDLDGTGKSPRVFFEVAPSSGVSVSFSFELSAAACGLSSMPRAISVVEDSAGGSTERIQTLLRPR